MERKDSEQHKSGTRTRFLGYEPLIPRERLRVIYRAAETVARQDKSKSEANKALIDQLVSQTSELDLLYNHAKDFLQGDSAARYRLIAVLNHIVRREGVQGEPPSETKSGRPIGGPEASKGDSPHTIGQAELITASSPGGQPCLVPPLRIADIFMGLLRICTEDPRIGGGGGICPDYLVAVGSLVEQVGDLEMLYAVATDVIKGKDPRAFPYFEATLELVRQSGFERFGVEPRLFSFSFGNPDGIPIALNRPRLFTDPCAEIKVEAAARAIECIQEVLGGPRYAIQDVINIAPGRERVSRRGCHGDEIEIQGSNLQVLRRIVFLSIWGRTEVTEYTTLEDERIRLIIPEGAREGDIWICIAPGGSGACPPHICRLAEPHTDHYFEVVWPPGIEEFSANDGEDRVEVEACTDIRFKVRATSAETAVVTERDTGAEVWGWESDEERPHAQGMEEFPDLDVPDSTTYILEVGNLCGTVRKALEVVIYHAVHLAVSAPRVAAGGTVDLTIRVSCRAPAGGLRVRLISSQADALPVPNEVVIPQDHTETTVTLTAGDFSAEVEITGEAPDQAPVHRPGSVDVLVFNVPVITGISPLGVDACSPFELQVYGDGFDPEQSANVVNLLSEQTSVGLNVTGIDFNDPDNRLHDAVLTCEYLGPGLVPWSYNVVVGHDNPTLFSESFDRPLAVTPLVPIIHRLWADPPSVRVGSMSIVQLNWDISNAAEVQITYTDARGQQVPIVVERPPCGRLQGATEITINWPQEVWICAIPLGWEGGRVCETLSIE